MFWFRFNSFTQGDSGWHGSAIDPEGNPGQHDHERGGKIRLQQEEEDVTPQREVDVQPVVPAWGERWREKIQTLKIKAISVTSLRAQVCERQVSARGVNILETSEPTRKRLVGGRGQRRKDRLFLSW